MTDIMKLADDYAQHKYVNGAEGRGPDAPEARTGYARAALQSAIEALQEENALLEGTLESRERNIAEMQAENERLELALEKACRKSEEFQARLDAMGKGEAVGEWKHCSPELLASGVSCRDTPRRPCECDHGGSHDHWIAAPKALAPLTDEQIYNVFAATVEDAEPFAELVGDPIWAEVVEITRSIEAAHGIHAKGGQHEDA